LHSVLVLRGHVFIEDGLCVRMDTRFNSLSAMLVMKVEAVSYGAVDLTS